MPEEDVYSHSGSGTHGERFCERGLVRECEGCASARVGMCMGWRARVRGLASASEGPRGKCKSARVVASARGVASARAVDD